MHNYICLYFSVRCDVIDWSTIPAPPRFIHEPNDPTIYFTLESTQTSNGHNLDYLKERTLRCIADGNPPPGCVFFFFFLNIKLKYLVIA